MGTPEVALELERTLAQCKYGKYAFLERSPTTVVSADRKQMLVQGIRHGDPTRLDGDCLELSEAVAKSMAKADSRNLYLCIGNDSHYFTERGTQHIYLIATSKSLPNDASSNPAELRPFVMNDCELIDPSFKRRVEFKESNYVSGTP